MKIPCIGLLRKTYFTLVRMKKERNISKLICVKKEDNKYYIKCIRLEKKINYNEQKGIERREKK